MKVLLLGATGYIGGSLPSRRPDWDWTLCSTRDFDLTNFDGDLEYHDVVINCAGFYGGLPFNLNHAQDILVQNARIFATVDRLIRKMKPQKTISIGSGCVYPGNVTDSISESDLDTGPYHNSVKYSGLAKRLELDLLRQLPENIGWEFLILCNVYGPGEHTDPDKSHVVGGLIKKFLSGNNSLMGTGSAVRDFFYIEDAAEAICRFAEIPATNSHTNISSGTGTSIKQLSTYISKYTNTKELNWSMNPKEDGVPVKILDNTKMKKDIGEWQYKNIDNGIKDTVDYIK